MQLFVKLGFLWESTIEDIGDRRRKPSSESSQLRRGRLSDNSDVCLLAQCGCVGIWSVGHQCGAGSG